MEKLTDTQTLLITKTDSINKKALDEAVAKWDATEFIPGGWLVKTDLAAKEFYNEIMEVTSGPVLVVPLTAEVMSHAFISHDIAPDTASHHAA